MLWVGWTTVADLAEAKRLASGLVEHRLAACVQIDGPLTSVYRWSGAIEQAEEFRLWIKFVDASRAALETWLWAHHPYEVPQWVVVRADAVGEKYLSWAQANSTSAPL